MKEQAVFPEWRAFLGSSEDSETRNFIKSVVKRSGDIVPYDRSKIESAIGKAIQAVEKHIDPDRAAALTDLVEERLRLHMAGTRAHSIPAIEEIQDIVESVLIENKEVEVAKAYIIYRARHEAMRDSKSLMLDINKTMDGYLGQTDWRVNENANVNFSLGGLILHNSGTITANYWLKNIYTPEIAEAHKTAAFHLHDLSMFSGYCAGWSLRQLIQEGLGGVSDKNSSRPAKHLSTLVNQMVNFLGIMQNEWAGAQAFSSFDTYLAPFVKTDNQVSPLSKNYFYKIIDLCNESGIELHLIHDPSEYEGERIDAYHRECNMIREIENEKSKDLLEKYLDSILYYPAECFIDDVHFKGDDALNDSVIRDMQRKTNLLEDIVL